MKASGNSNVMVMLAEGDVAVKLHSFVVALTFVPMVIEVLAAATATLVLMVNEVSPPTQLSFVAEVSPLIVSSAGVIGTVSSAILVSVVVAVHVATTKATRMKNLVVGVYMV
jgi:hypothetical protein